MTLTADLVRIAADAADEAAMDRAAWHLLDWTGIVIAARAEPAAQRFAAACGLSGDAVQALGATELAAETRAFGLGALGNLLEMDDLHRASLLHVGDVVCPAVLAVGFETEVSGASLLAALVGGYETAIRIGRAAARSGYSAWYNSGTCGVFGAAYGAARILGLEPLGSQSALGLAGMQAGGLWQCRLEPGDGKQLATAHAARAGVTSALAASAGMHGPAQILEGPLGFMSTFYPDADPAEIVTEPTAPALLHEVSFKPWPACRHTHPAVAAALDLRGNGLKVEEVATVTVQTYAAAISFCDCTAPKTQHDARFSLQHAVATALLHGADAVAHLFDPAIRDDPRTAALRARVALVEAPEMTRAFPAHFAAKLEVMDADGTLWQSEAPHAPGDPERPLSEAEILSKFHRNCRSGGVSARDADALAQALLALPAAGDLSVLRAAYSLLNVSSPVPHPNLRSLR